jgi:hypothetical protein
MEREILNVLKNELGYSPPVAQITCRDLMAFVDADLKCALNTWLSTRHETPVHEGSISTTQLIREYHMHYPAALIFIDWLRCDDSAALNSLNHPE